MAIVHRLHMDARSNERFAGSIHATAQCTHRKRAPPSRIPFAPVGRACVNPSEMLFPGIAVAAAVVTETAGTLSGTVVLETGHRPY
jgi:hypothetical protein